MCQVVILIDDYHRTYDEIIKYIFIIQGVRFYNFTVVVVIVVVVVVEYLQKYLSKKRQRKEDMMCGHIRLGYSIN